MEIPESWPGAEFGRYVDAGGLTWRVNIRGRGPVVLLLHGTGASAHSWVPLAPLLESQFTLVMPDLPGQGFSELADVRHSTLTGMARAVASLLETLAIEPVLVVGHSAGAAVACALSLTGRANPAAIVSINGALLPFGRAAAPVFSRAAKFLASSSVFPHLVALHAVSRKPVERMLRQTGSDLPPEMVRCYRTLLGDAGHVAGTLRMMANWDLVQLEENFDRLEPLLVLLCCDNDLVVAPAQGEELKRRFRAARLAYMAGLGHLGHEEAPALFAEHLKELAEEVL